MLARVKERATLAALTHAPVTRIQQHTHHLRHLAANYVPRHRIRVSVSSSRCDATPRRTQRVGGGLGREVFGAAAADRDDGCTCPANLLSCRAAAVACNSSGRLPGAPCNASGSSRRPVAPPPPPPRAFPTPAAATPARTPTPPASSSSSLFPCISSRSRAASMAAEKAKAGFEAEPTIHRIRITLTAMHKHVGNLEKVKRRG